MDCAEFLKEKEQIDRLPDPEQEAYYVKWLENNREKTVTCVNATLSYAQVLYREGKFRECIDALLSVTFDHKAYPYCKALIACFNLMGLAVNCEAERGLARHYFQIALELAQEYQATEFYAKLHNNIGLTYYDQNDFEAAGREYAEGSKWLSVSTNREIIKQMIYGNWTNTLLAQGRWQDALETYYKTTDCQAEGALPDKEEDLYLALIVYYKTGKQKEFAICKQRLIDLAKVQDLEGEVCHNLLRYKIGREDHAFTELLLRKWEELGKENPASFNWSGNCELAKQKYAYAEEIGDVASMKDALRLKIDFQKRAIEDLQKRREDALLEYIRVSEEKQEALEQAEEATRAKSQFLSNMSHDIRTPMNAIFGLTKLMEHDKNDPEKMDVHIQKLQASSRHLLSLINDVLDMSKIESSEITLNREDVNIAEQVSMLDSVIRPWIDDRNQNFHIGVHEISHENLIGDATRLRQVLLNLLSNAVKYTQNNGDISFDVTEKYSGEKDRTVFVFTVTDNGCGISKKFLEHIFEPFTREEASVTNRVQGTGLGMAITKNIVDLMGGTISVESELGKGSSFTVTVPMVLAEDAVPFVPAEKILLIAQDEVLVKNETAAFMETDVQLLIANDVTGAEEALAQNKVDVILLAGQFDRERLADIVNRLRKKEENAELVFCVDYGQNDSMRTMFRECGIKKIVTRPIFLTNLAAVLNQPAEDAAEQGKKEEKTLKGMKFLCAEDNALNAELLEAILGIEGAVCTILSDGKQMVEKFETVKPGEYDAILMDVQMPIMNGLDAARAIRNSSNPLGKTIPIIAMTANAFSSDAQDCLDAGMDAHLSKPMDITMLERTIGNLTGKCFPGGGRVFTPRERK